MLGRVKNDINKMEDQVSDTGKTFKRVNENMKKIGIE